MNNRYCCFEHSSYNSYESHSPRNSCYYSDDSDSDFHYNSDYESDKEYLSSDSSEVDEILKKEQEEIDAEEIDAYFKKLDGYYEELDREMQFEQELQKIKHNLKHPDYIPDDYYSDSELYKD